MKSLPASLIPLRTESKLDETVLPISPSMFCKVCWPCFTLSVRLLSITPSSSLISLVTSGNWKAIGNNYWMFCYYGIFWEKKNPSETAKSVWWSSVFIRSFGKTLVRLYFRVCAHKISEKKTKFVSQPVGKVSEIFVQNISKILLK